MSRATDRGRPPGRPTALLASAGFSLLLGLFVGLATAEAAPTRCVTQSDWHVCYESTATDGLRVTNVTFRGESVLASGSLPQIDVSYTGFTLLDELGTEMVPAVGSTQTRQIDGGFEIVQVYQMAAWPQCGTYRYDQAWRFYSDGSFEPFVTTFGPGVEGPHTYRTYWRLELAPGDAGGDRFEYWTNGWTRPATEGRYPWTPPAAPDGSKWRIVDDGEGWAMSPAPEDDGPKVWVLRKNPAQGEIDLPAQRRVDFPDQWDNDESIQNQTLVLWYEMEIYKGTNCDQTMRVGTGPRLTRVSEPPTPTVPPSPTLPPTDKPPTPTVVVPTPGPTQPGSTTVRGRIELQGRDEAAGATIELDDTVRAVTGPDGSFEIQGVVPGEHRLAVDALGYLCTERTINVTADSPLEVPAVTLQGGDITRDGVVNILDLTAVGTEYGNPAPGGSRADVNLDGVVNVFDLVLVSSNYGGECPTDW